jgi:hypothetical protein
MTLFGRRLRPLSQRPKLKMRFADLGGTVLPGMPADVAKLIADDTDKWGKVIKFSGAKAG